MFIVKNIFLFKKIFFKKYIFQKNLYNKKGFQFIRKKRHMPRLPDSIRLHCAEKVYYFESK